MSYHFFFLHFRLSYTSINIRICTVVLACWDWPMVYSILRGCCFAPRTMAHCSWHTHKWAKAGKNSTVKEGQPPWSHLVCSKTVQQGHASIQNVICECLGVKKNKVTLLKLYWTQLCDLRCIIFSPCRQKAVFCISTVQTWLYHSDVSHHTIRDGERTKCDYFLTVFRSVF